jgi:hypothetical protein
MPTRFRGKSGSIAVTKETAVYPCWADKIPFWIFLAVTVVLFVLGSVGSNPASDRWWDAFLWVDGFLFLKFILPAWVVLRIIDFMVGGPTIRVARRRAREATGYSGVEAETANW